MSSTSENTSNSDVDSEVVAVQYEGQEQMAQGDDQSAKSIAPPCVTYTGHTYKYPIEVLKNGNPNDLSVSSSQGIDPASNVQVESQKLVFGQPLSPQEMDKRDKTYYSHTYSDPEEWKYPPLDKSLKGTEINTDKLLFEVLGESCANPTASTMILQDGTPTIGAVTVSNGEVIYPTKIRFAESWYQTNEGYAKCAIEDECGLCAEKECYIHVREREQTEYRLRDVTFSCHSKDDTDTKVYLDTAIMRHLGGITHQQDWEVQCVGDHEVKKRPEGWIEGVPISSISFDALFSGMGSVSGLIDNETCGYTITIRGLTRPEGERYGLAEVTHFVPIDHGSVACTEERE